MSYKKAGIIVGALLIIIAIVVAVVVNNSSDSSEKPQKQPATTTTSQKAWEDDTKTPAETSKGTQDKVGIIQIDSETLPEPSFSNEIGVVQDKSMVLIDGSLYYALYLLVGSDNEQMSYFVSRNGYDAVNLGDKCNVALETYKTTNGSVYRLVSGLSLVE